MKLRPMASYFYEQVDPRRLKEWRDSHIVNEDKGAVANLPQKPINREWQKGGIFPIIDIEIG